MTTNASERYDAYVICTSPRSGSTLLCKLLAATRVAGNPESYFHEASMASWAAELSLASEGWSDDRDFLAAILRAAIAAGSLDTGLFGLRLQRHSFDFFMRKLATLYRDRDRGVERLQAAFGKTLFIHLTRSDKVGQAVSCVRAEQTGLWHVAADGTELERLKPHADPVYDGARIRQCFDEMVTYDHQWCRWFAQQGIRPLRLTYAELAADPPAALRRVLRGLGLPEAAASGVTAGVRRLSDATSRAWVSRFLAEQPDARLAPP